MGLMRIFALGDIHDDLEALETACDYIAATGADRILCTGDVLLRPYRREDLSDLVASRDISSFLLRLAQQGGRTLTSAKQLLDRTGIPYHIVPGNYDPLLEEVFGAADLHRKSADLGGLTITGYGGADILPDHIAVLEQFGKTTPYNLGELYRTLADADADIVLLHNPPLGTCDVTYRGENVGAQSAAAFVREHKPDLVVCGHIHESGPLGGAGLNPASVAGLVRIQHPDGLSTLILNPGNLGRFELIKFPTLEPIARLPYGTFTSVDLREDGCPLRAAQYLLATPDRRIGDVRELGSVDFSS